MLQPDRESLIESENDERALAAFFGDGHSKSAKTNAVDFALLSPRATRYSIARRRISIAFRFPRVVAEND
jgi:hypothetical protein